MNFTELYKKINSLDKGIESPITECACEEMGPDESQKQQDNVNMNITINGQGAGGIRDLMDILRNINDKEDPTTPHDEHNDDSMIIGEPNIAPQIEPIRIQMEPTEAPMEEPTEEVIDDSYGNSVEGGSDAKQFAISSVIGMGDDLASKGKGALKANGGENPFNVKESLVKNLHN